MWLGGLITIPAYPFIRTRLRMFKDIYDFLAFCLHDLNCMLSSYSHVLPAYVADLVASERDHIRYCFALTCHQHFIVYGLLNVSSVEVQNYIIEDLDLGIII